MAVPTHIGARDDNHVTNARGPEDLASVEKPPCEARRMNDLKIPLMLD